MGVSQTLQHEKSSDFLGAKLLKQLQHEIWMGKQFSRCSWKKEMNMPNYATASTSSSCGRARNAMSWFRASHSHSEFCPNSSRARAIKQGDVIQQEAQLCRPDRQFHMQEMPGGRILEKRMRKSAPSKLSEMITDWPL